jgi:alkane 1-monooxygenase
MKSALKRFVIRTIWPLRFVLILTIPLSLYDAVRLGRLSDMPNLFAFWPFFVIFGLLSALDYVVGHDKGQPAPDVREQSVYKWIALATLPVHLAALAWSLHVFATVDFNWIGQLGWILSTGVISGSVAITAGHELIHRPTRFEQSVGGVLLASVCYGGFKIEHIYGHHVHVATPEDASSARFGQTVYGFVPQALANNFKNAWKLSLQLARKRGRPAWRNEFLVWASLSALFAFGIWQLFGMAGLVFFLAQSLVAICELEAINYVEHYGLARRRHGQAYERVAPEHSWNSSYRLMNWFLLNLARHSDHHAAAARRYQELRHIEAAPQLPGGYSAMLMLSLVPPLWFRVIHPRIPANMREN